MGGADVVSAQNLRNTAAVALRAVITCSDRELPGRGLRRLRTFAALIIMAALAGCSGDPSGSRDSLVARESPESVAPAGPPPEAGRLRI
jgi:hypothetical protein